jgi:hypothetical protein
MQSHQEHRKPDDILLVAQLGGFQSLHQSLLLIGHHYAKSISSDHSEAASLMVTVAPPNSHKQLCNT